MRGVTQHCDDAEEKVKDSDGRTDDVTDDKTADK